MMISLPDLERGDLFGETLDVSGNIAVVALNRADFGAGAVAVFEHNEESGWEHVTTLRSPSGGLEAVRGDMVDCAEGSAGIFSCDMVDMLAFLPIREVGGERGVQL